MRKPRLMSELVALALGEGEGDVAVKLAPWSGRDEQQWQLLDGPKHFSG